MNFYMLNIYGCSSLIIAVQARGPDGAEISK